MSAYNQLLDLKNQGKLDLIVVIAPPRTGSTMLQSVLSKSRSVGVGVNDPQEQEEGYQRILNEAHRLLVQQSTVTILMKEMSHWIQSDNEYRRIFALTDKVVLSIRNPLLSTESRLKKFIESLTIKSVPMVHQLLIDKVSLDSNFTEINLINQKRLLDLYAEHMGFSNWEKMVSVSYQEQNYVSFAELLQADNSSTGFSLEQLGWQAISEEVKYLSEIGKTPIVIDSTDLRLTPELITRKLCRKLDIEFDFEMIQGWTKQDFTHLITEKTPEDQEVQSLWYDSISRSEGIKPPTEKVPLFTSFPDNIQNYIRTVAMPIYVELYASEFRLQIEGAISHEGRTMRSDDLRNTDPIFFMLSENTQLSAQVLLKMLLSRGEDNEKDFAGRRK